MVRNVFAISITTLPLANGIAQMNLPYLFFVLVVEQLVALAAFTTLDVPAAVVGVIAFIATVRVTGRALDWFETTDAPAARSRPDAGSGTTVGPPV